ncbi:9163_t:CDS:1, partial [Cetraspora pellucida]
PPMIVFSINSAIFRRLKDVKTSYMFAFSTPFTHPQQYSRSLTSLLFPALENYSHSF